MSDIAMLVAEEYERRVKTLTKEGGSGGEGGGGAGEIHMLSSVSLMLSTLKQKKHFLQRAFQPKTQLAMAASNSFFSA